MYTKKTVGPPAAKYGLTGDPIPFLGAAMKDGATKGGATRSAFKGKQFTSTVPRMPAAAGEGLFSKKTYEYAAEPFVEAPTASKKEEVKSGFYSSAVAGREALAATIPVRRLREAIAREDKFVSRLAETAAAELGASGSSTGAGGAGAAGGGGAGYTFGSPAFSPLRAGGAKEAWEMSTPSPGLSRSTRVQGKFEVDGRDVRAGIARHMYDHVHSGAASTPPDWQRTKKDTFYHLKTRSSEERPRYGDLGTSAEAIGYGATEATAAPEHGKRSATKAFFSKGHLSTRGAGGPVADAL